MGVTIRKPKAAPANRRAEDAAAALYEAVRDELGGLPVDRQLALAEAAHEGSAWSDLDDWARALFRRVSERVA